MVNTSKNRIHFFDCTRALCMLYIIALWHMPEYISGFSIVSPYTEIVTKGVLGTFTFISAYFLGKRPITKKSDVFDFYKRRLLRLYPLFFLSCTSLLAVHYLFYVDFISGIKQYGLTLAGLSVIILPAPKTVWYVSMIILFYIITPLFNYLKTLVKQFLCFFAVMLTLVVVHYTLGLVDARVLINFPVFFAGLIFSNRVNMTDHPDWRAYLIGIPLFGLGFWLSLVTEFITLSVVTVIGFILLALEIGKLFAHIVFIHKCLSFISIGSMVAYLFHRQFFGLVQKLTGHFSILAAYLIILPVLLSISYCVQIFYDKILDTILKRISKKRTDKDCIRKN